MKFNTLFALVSLVSVSTAVSDSDKHGDKVESLMEEIRVEYEKAVDSAFSNSSTSSLPSQVKSSAKEMTEGLVSLVDKTKKLVEVVEADLRGTADQEVVDVAFFYGELASRNSKGISNSEKLLSKIKDAESRIESLDAATCKAILPKGKTAPSDLAQQRNVIRHYLYIQRKLFEKMVENHDDWKEIVSQAKKNHSEARTVVRDNSSTIDKPAITDASVGKYLLPALDFEVKTSAAVAPGRSTDGKGNSASSVSSESWTIFAASFVLVVFLF